MRAFLDERSVLGERQGTASESHHARIAGAQHLPDCLALVSAERIFSFPRKDLWDRSMGANDEVVGVEERAAQLARELAPDRGFSSSHKSDERHVALHCTFVPGFRENRSADACVLRARLSSVSSSESPPYFSKTGPVSARRTIASATMAAAGTTQTSLRTIVAGASVFSCRFTDGRGFISVGIGFTETRTTIGSPLLIPPSMPPARLLRRTTLSPSSANASCAREPGVAPDRVPRPISTARTVCIPISAPARTPSSR